MLKMPIDKNKIIVILGPTASGKSDLATKIAKKLKRLAPTPMHGCGGEIISADSRQVYRGMDIGTGKVKKDKYKGHLCITKMSFVSNGIRHHLLDVANPKKQFTVSDFKELGEKAIKEITARKKIPIIVGGTGLYIDVLLGRMAIAEVPPNPKLRAKLKKQSAEQLFKRLSILDPQRAKIIDYHNKRRLIRAIEIALFVPHKSTTQAIARVVEKRDILWLGINPGEKKLTQKIKSRLDQRLRQGMIKEVEKLHNPPSARSGGGGGISWKRLDDFGLEYRWISRWLIKNLNLKIKNYNSKFKSSDEYKNLLRDIIRYSKRQMTWFKRNKKIHWVKNMGEAEKIMHSSFLDSHH